MVVNGFVFLAGLAVFTGTILRLAKGPKPTADANTARSFQTTRWVLMAVILIVMVTCLGQSGELAVAGLAIGALIGVLAWIARRGKT
ncbi:MAG: hypothetical protein P4L53_04820 [Candidatus Obscuribacterales bacterium]|nr:hypothetical protein [Candidatus Obscuribacterales bacterium]